MTPTYNFHACVCGCARWRNEPTALELLLINLITEKVMAKLSDLQTQLTELAAQSAKVNAEVKGKLTELAQKIIDLEAQIGNTDVDVPQAILDSVAAIKATTGELDELIPDATPA